MFANLFNRKQRPIQTKKQDRNRVRLDLERLEDRVTPAGIEYSLVSPGAQTPDPVSVYGNAIFAQSDLDDAVTGTGVFKPFLRLQDNKSEEGINTSAKTVQFDTKAGIWTHAIQLQDLGIVTIPDFGDFYEFQLDINEPVGGNKFNDLSMDTFELWVAPTSDLTYNQTTRTLAGATKVYDMDTVQDNWLHLRYTTVGSGSGRGDLKAYVSTSYFAGKSPASYLYLYNENGKAGTDANGRNVQTQDGFEEWKAFIGLDPATKSGTKFNDLNANGQRDAGEPGIEGWNIHLYGTDVLGNPVHQTTTTNDDGEYTFTVLPGHYTVAEELLPEWYQSFPQAGDGIVDTSGHTDDGTFTPAPLGYGIVLTDGEVETGNDFGNWQYASKSGYKFHDLNADGDWDDDEPTIEGWEIHLYGTDGTGADVHLVDFTDETGQYYFSVKPGSYTVAEEQREGWYQSFPQAGTGIVDTSGHTDGGTFTPAPLGYAVILTSGYHETDNNFGNWQYAYKSGQKWLDFDGSGTRDNEGRGVDDILGTDDDEPFLEGWEIRAYADANGNLLLDQDEYDGTYVSDTTDVNGAYSFTLLPGDYIIVEVLQDGWLQSYPGEVVLADGLNTGTEVLGPTGWAITLVSGQTDAGNDFGNQPTPGDFDISGRKFDDGNGDGLPDGIPGADDTPLAGVKISLYFDFNNDGTFDAEDKLASKDNLDADAVYTVFDITPEAGEQDTLANGSYLFNVDFLIPELTENKEYRFFVVETVPTGYYQTWPQNPNTYYTVTATRTGGVVSTTSDRDQPTGDGTPDGTPDISTDNLDFANATEFEGKTPGFWKTNAENWDAVAWTDPIDPTDLVDSLFDIPAGFSYLASQTLLTALSAEDRVDGGNPFNAAENMLRQAVAAALNSVHPFIEYPIDLDAVKALVNSAFESGEVDDFNAVKALLESYNTLEGGINQHNEPT